MASWTGACTRHRRCATQHNYAGRPEAAGQVRSWIQERDPGMPAGGLLHLARRPMPSGSAPDQVYLGSFVSAPSSHICTVPQAGMAGAAPLREGAGCTTRG